MNERNDGIVIVPMHPSIAAIDRNIVYGMLLFALGQVIGWMTAG